MENKVSSTPRSGQFSNNTLYTKAHPRVFKDISATTFLMILDALESSTCIVCASNAFGFIEQYSVFGKLELIYYP